jgi:hypothetical protein
MTPFLFRPRQEVNWSRDMSNDGTLLLTDSTTPSNGLMKLAGPIFQRAKQDADQMPAKLSPPSGESMYMTAQIRDLKAEIERISDERDRLLQMQSRVLELLGTDRPERLVHDLRNVLNERALFRALAETVM